jgi:hypothetical protein
VPWQIHHLHFSRDRPLVRGGNISPPNGYLVSLLRSTVWWVEYARISREPVGNKRPDVHSKWM